MRFSFKHIAAATALVATIASAAMHHDVYALNKIRYVRISNDYHMQTGYVDATQLSFRPANSGYELEYELQTPPADIGVGDNYIIHFHLSCIPGYLFTDVKEASCQIQGDSNSYLKEMHLSEDGSTLDLTFDMSPLRMQLPPPENLGWDGDIAIWDPVTYASGYNVTVSTINDRGGLNRQSKAQVADNRANLRSKMFSEAGDYVYSVTAIPKAEDYYLSASEPAVLDYENSKMVTAEDVGIDDGYFTTDSQGNTSYVRSSKRLASGDYLIEGFVYRFDDSGYMMHGFQDISGLLYYYGDTGQLQYGWFKDNDHWYYADEKGIIQTGFTEIDGKTFYLDPMLTGRMATGWKRIGEKTFYFLPDGSLNTNKLIDENRIVSVFDKDGSLITQYHAN